MIIASPAFQDNDAIPAKYGRSVDDVNPPLDIDDVPADSESLALIMDDPDAPGGTFTHWVIYSISPTISRIEEGELPAGVIEGGNDYGETSYGGPQPPSGTHRYRFKLYALDSEPELEAEATAEELQEAMEDHVLAQAELVGTYSA